MNILVCETKDGGEHIHAAGCIDVAKRIHRGSYCDEPTPLSVEDVEQYAANERAYFERNEQYGVEVRVFDCCKSR